MQRSHKLQKFTLKFLTRKKLPYVFQSISLMEKHSLTPARVFNSDMIGITNVQVSHKILTQKGQIWVSFTTCAEKGRQLTAQIIVTCCFSSSRIYVALIFVFACERMNLQLKKKRPLGAEHFCLPNCWKNNALFVIWLDHSLHSVMWTKDDTVLLIIDKHVSHYTLKV